MQSASKPEVAKRREEQINCIEAYIKAYHYANFDEVYREFDKNTLVLLSKDYGHFRESSSANNLFGENYEQFSYLNELKMSDIYKKFFDMRQPFQTDSKKNIIDYNWHVDGILKNSQSYNKEGKNGPKQEEEKP